MFSRPALTLGKGSQELTPRITKLVSLEWRVFIQVYSFAGLDSHTPPPRPLLQTFRSLLRCEDYYCSILATFLFTNLKTHYGCPIPDHRKPWAIAGLKPQAGTTFSPHGGLSLEARRAPCQVRKHPWPASDPTASPHRWKCRSTWSFVHPSTHSTSIYKHLQ